MEHSTLVMLETGFVAGLFIAAGPAELRDLIVRHVRPLSRREKARRHEYRQTWLDLSDRLAGSGCRADLELAIPRAYREVFGSASALLYVRDGRSTRFLPAYTPAPGPFELSPALFAYFETHSRVWDPSAGNVPANETERAFVREAGACLAVPLVSGKVLEGVLLLGARQDRPFSAEDHDLMRAIARHAGLLLSNERLARELIEARELAAVARVSSFVIHDLKNQANTLSLLLNNAEQHLGNTEFQQDMLSAVRRTVADMKLLMQKLKGVPVRERSLPQATDVRALCDEVVREFARTRTRAFLVSKGEPVACTVVRSELRTVLVNLLQNGLDAAGEAGAITVETKRENGRARITVSDNGCGMPREFLEQQLFRPFRSTKKTGLGIGLYQSRQIVGSFGGVLSAESRGTAGSTFTIELPALPAMPAAREGAGPGGDGRHPLKAVAKGVVRLLRGRG